MAAPIGGLLWGFGAFLLRISFLWIIAKRRGVRFDALDRPPPAEPAIYTGAHEGSTDEEREAREEREENEPAFQVKPQKGKFF